MERVRAAHDSIRHALSTASNHEALNQSASSLINFAGFGSGILIGRGQRHGQMVAGENGPSISATTPGLDSVMLAARSGHNVRAFHLAREGRRAVAQLEGQSNSIAIPLFVTGYQLLDRPFELAWKLERLDGVKQVLHSTLLMLERRNSQSHFGDLSSYRNRAVPINRLGTRKAPQRPRVRSGRFRH